MIAKGIFLQKVKKTKTCWFWNGAKIKTGYGKIHSGPFMLLAHRVSWVFFRGKIPSNRWVLHKCDIKNCVNPKHLYLGTRADNVNDAIRRGRIKRGNLHPFTKLTDEEKQEIRFLYQPHQGRLLGRIYNVSGAHAWAVAKGFK